MRKNKYMRINSGPLKPLEPILDNWIKIVGDPEWGEQDASWWYNERASLSQFAGAVW